MLGLLGSFLISQPSQALDLSESDKQKHIQVSAAIVLGSYATMRALGYSKPKALIISTISSLGAGLVKEYVIDKQADPNDLKANVVGIGLGLVLPAVVEF